VDERERTVESIVPSIVELGSREQSREDPLLSVPQNLIEQDHRRIKSRFQPMLEFKRSTTRDA